MIKEIELSIHPDFVFDYEHQKKQAAKKLKLNPEEITAVQVIRRSIDARKFPVYKLRVMAFINEPVQELYQEINFKNVD